ncbi:MAG TPA: rhomboid family intramembrane serine protease [Pseudonocardia sp.]|nr:rhomboid family intramembrane serine protease [Pseudonocardia sp.]
MVAPGVGPRRSPARVLPASPLRAALTMVLFTASLYVVEVADLVSGGELDAEGGIEPRELDGLDGVLFAPLLHGGWAHLIANTVPFLVFGFLAMAGGIRQFVMVTATIWLLGGLAVWLLGPADTNHIGASGLIFGWFVFLLARGFYARSGKQVVLAVVLFLIWGGVLWGVLPGEPDISWQGHLFGALAGLLAARLAGRADRRPTLDG